MKIPGFVFVLVFAAACGGDSAQTRPIPGDRGPAITVEVLNANGRGGDARIGTQRLRRAGMDVVYFLDSAKLLDVSVLLGLDFHP